MMHQAYKRELAKDELERLSLIERVVEELTEKISEESSCSDPDATAFALSISTSKAVDFDDFTAETLLRNPFEQISLAPASRYSRSMMHLEEKPFVDDLSQTSNLWEFTNNTVINVVMAQ